MRKSQPLKTMTEENFENTNSSNSDASGEQENQQNDTSNSEDNSNELTALKEKNRQLFERTKKAEAEVKEFRTKLPKEEPKPKAESNEPNYGRLAYLQAKGIDHPDDIRAVEDESNRLKLPLTDVLQMEHIKTKLQVNKDARTAQTGMPGGSNRAGGATQHDVDYWLQKGGLPENDQELAEKVVNARMSKDDSRRQFDSIR